MNLESKLYSIIAAKKGPYRGCDDLALLYCKPYWKIMLGNSNGLVMLGEAVGEIESDWLASPHECADQIASKMGVTLE